MQSSRRRDGTSDTPDGTAPPGLGPSLPFAVPEGSPENVPSSFRAVPFTRMRHTIGQPRKRPAVRKPVDSPVKSRTACPFSGNCPERPVPFPGRCPIAWAPLRTMGLPAQNGLLLPIYASLACHRPLPDADNGKNRNPYETAAANLVSIKKIAGRPLQRGATELRCRR